MTGGAPILTAAAMRAAEAEAMERGVTADELMRRAGEGAAEAILRFAGPLPTLILCGPGNNGGDGYVIARTLAARGVAVRVAALAEPQSTPARHARAAWDGPVEALDRAEPAPLLVDALFGTGLARPLDCQVAAELARLARAAQVRVAVDLPSGVATDEGALLSAVPAFDLTVTFGAPKPAHYLQPAARHMGRIACVDIGIVAASDLTTLARPVLKAPGPDSHKYDRGFVLVLGGDLGGASGLAASAALRAGAGAVRLAVSEPLSFVPLAIMQVPIDKMDLAADERLGAILFGPGLIPGEESAAQLDQCLESGVPLVLDAGAITLLAERGGDALSALATPAILTPHPGEFSRLFGSRDGDKRLLALGAARRSGAVIVFKGADTVIAAPDGRCIIAPDASSWLATAGSGDVLAGAIAAVRAAGLDAFEAAAAGVWLHGRAAQIAGPGLIADDLVTALRGAYLECL